VEAEVGGARESVGAVEAKEAVLFVSRRISRVFGIASSYGGRGADASSRRVEPSREGATALGALQSLGGPADAAYS